MIITHYEHARGDRVKPAAGAGSDQECQRAFAQQGVGGGVSGDVKGHASSLPAANAAICRNFSQVPWSRIKRMRDRLAHHYEATDYDAVWATINVDLPRVRAAIAPLLPS
jgi:hypothetical protein